MTILRQDNIKQTACSLSGALLIFTTFPAIAQIVEISDQDVITASERLSEESRGERATPSKVGAFFFRPQVGVQTIYDDNIVASAQDEESDLITVVTPGVALSSDWNNHALFLNANAEIGLYDDNSSENYQDLEFILGGRLDILRNATVDTRAVYVRRHEDRTSVNDTGGATPTEIDDIVLQSTFNYSSGRFAYAFTQSYQNLTFEDNRTSLGVLDNSGRDRDILTTVGRVSYEIIPNYRMFLQTSYGITNYDLDTSQNRDADRFAVNVGTEIHITGKVKANVFAGYASTDFDNPVFDDIDVFDFGGDLTWNLSGKTSIIGEIQQTVEETIDQNSAGILQTTFNAALQHELHKKLLLEIEGEYRIEDFDGGPSANQRKDDTIALTIGGNYYAARNLTVNLDYQYSERDSNSDNDDFTRNRVILGARMRF